MSINNFRQFSAQSMDVTIPGQSQPPPCYPPTTIGDGSATFPHAYPHHVPPVSSNEVYQQVQSSSVSFSYHLHPTSGAFTVNPPPIPTPAWPLPSGSSHMATFSSYPFVNEFAAQPSANLRDAVWPRRGSENSATTFQSSSSSGKRLRLGQEEESGSWTGPMKKKPRINPSTDNPSAVQGPSIGMQSGSTARPACFGYRTGVLCNDELREKLKSSPGRIPNSRLFFLGGFPLVAHINQPLPSAEEKAKQKEEARRRGRSTGVPLNPEEIQWLIKAYSCQSHTGTTPHKHGQVHHQQSGHRNQDHIGALGQDALPNDAQSSMPISLQYGYGSVMMHRADGSSQSPPASEFSDPGLLATYDEPVEPTSDRIPQAIEDPASYPPPLAHQGSNIVARAKEGTPTLITSPSRESVDDTMDLMDYGHMGRVHLSFQAFQGSDIFETCSKKTNDADDDDDESLFGVLFE
ncbi:uncharacterized protein BT62DRAFT_760182 [Guyanagaster necrorhizus]|uniref:Uncharacterized protein n=1 Tax=Guyanagaster necrorhizus TaxID=856835 RepID=A0A9P7VWK2_9AGAR|nr:uncharacterized protein BT62DRAFT_760182 [Guyanagaster necrorhizus MCA 3950]KAG7448232.1 hypothetical protein BT62DRAFT_760182 [Guyanagaster necrorhizus MCA 3950]